MDDCICETCVRKDCQDRMQFGDLRVLLYCADYLNHKPTNADRIRAMSDEELAEFLCSVYDDDFGKFINGYIIPCYDEDSIKEWLQQPMEEA